MVDYLKNLTRTLALALFGWGIAGSGSYYVLDAMGLPPHPNTEWSFFVMSISAVVYIRTEEWYRD